MRAFPAGVRGLRRLAREPARPAAVSSRPGAPWLAIGTVCVGAFMGQLDASIVSLAYPTLKADFHTSLGAVQWVGLAYLLVLASTVVAIGRMADMVGRKLLYTYGFVVFALGSALCALAPSLLALDGFRALQALGAAMMQANSVAIVALAAPRDRLGRAIGIQGAAQALGLAVGPALGGLLIGLGGWRLIFWVNVPVGVVGVCAAWFLVPRSRGLGTREPFDWAGLALFAPALCALLLAISFGNERGWASPGIVALLAAAAALTASFLARERAARAPMLDLRLFARPAFSVGIASGLLSYLVLFGALFVTPFLLEQARGLSPAAAGGVLMVCPVALGVAAPLAGRATDTIGARAPTVAGMTLAAGALVLLALFHGSLAALLGELALLGAGLGLFTPPNNAAIMGAAPSRQAGIAGGTLNLTRGLGTSFGLAFTALVFGIVAGSRAAPHAVDGGFSAAAFFLAGVAAAAAVVAGARGRGGARARGAARPGECA